MRRHARIFDNPFLMGVASLFVLLAINVVAFDVPLIPVTASNGQTISLGLGAAGLPLLAILLLMMLFTRRKRHG